MIYFGVGQSYGKIFWKIGPFSICRGKMFQGCFIGTRRICWNTVVGYGAIYGKNLVIVSLGTGKFLQRSKITGQVNDRLV